jgi:hypothetical protein
MWYVTGQKVLNTEKLHIVKEDLTGSQPCDVDVNVGGYRRIIKLPLILIGVK